jgi:hypothetical protein
LLTVDLAGVFVSAASPAAGGGSTQVTLTVQNGGTTRLSRRVGIDFYAVAEGEVFDPATSAFLGSTSRVFNLNGGGSANVTLQVPLGAELTSGNYRLAAVLDPRNRIGESDETNNVVESGTIAVTHIDADVVAAFGQFNDIPSALVTGTQARGSAQVLISNANSSTASIPPGTDMRVEVVARPTGAADDSQDIVLGSADLRLRGGGFAPGATDRLTIPLRFERSLPAGTYDIVLLADTQDTIAESNEANNVVVFADHGLTVAAPFADPALAIDPDQRFPTTIAANGQDFPITVDISNEGNQRIAQGTKVSIGLVAHPVGGGADVDLGTFSNVRIGGLSPGRALAFTLVPTIPEGLPLGDYTFVATLNTGIAGDDLLNNVAQTPAVTVAEAAFDVAAEVESSGGPITIVEGTLVRQRVVVDVSNSGTLELPRNQRVNVVVALRPAGDESGASDLIIGRSRNAFVGNLEPGDLQRVEVITTIPFTVPVGDYELIATITPKPDLQETSEGNNTAAGDVVSVVERFADVGILGAGSTFSPGAQPGSTGFGVVTLENFGTIAARGQVGVQFFASSTGSIDGGQFIGSGTFHVNLSPGETGSASVRVTLPGVLTDMALYARILPSGFVDGDSGNDVASAGELTGDAGGVDLTVATASNPFGSSALGGATGEALVSIANVGAVSSSGSFTVRFFASTSDTIDANAIQIGSVTRNIVLGPGTTSLVFPVALTLPNPAEDTSYTLLAQVRASGGVDLNGDNDLTGPLGTVAVTAV